MGDKGRAAPAGARCESKLGNKKSVGIAIVRDAGEAYTIDVKGLAGKTGWPIDNIPEGMSDISLMSFCSKYQPARSLARRYTSCHPPRWAG